MKLEVLTTDRAAEWIKALEPCPHDFYHLPQYHAVAERCDEGEALLFHYSEGEYSIAVPLLLRSTNGIAGFRLDTDFNDATSVYGYAGPVASHPSIPQPVVDNFQARFKERLLDLGIVTLFSRLHPLLAQENLLAGMGEYQVLSRTVSIDLTLPEQVQRSAFRSSLRTAINKLRRNDVTFRLDPSGIHLNDFLEIYYETMRRVNAAPIYFFPPDYFRKLRSELGDRFHLGICMSDQQVVCAGIFIECGGILQYHLGGTLTSALNLAPMKLLVDEMRIWATHRKLKVLHLGGGTTSRPDDPLLHFKLGFSDRTHEFAVWRWILDRNAYQQLCRERSQWNLENGVTAASAHFFPQYRAPVIPLALPAPHLACAAPSAEGARA